MRSLILLAWALLFTSSRNGWAAQDELPRRAMLGARLAEVNTVTRDRYGPGGGGVVLEDIVPSSSAAAAGFKPDDILVAMDGVKIPGVAWLLGQLGDRRAGDEVGLDFVRDGQTLRAHVTLQEAPRETGVGYDVFYNSVSNGPFRQRIIVTRPRYAAARHPAVLLLQGGHTCFPVDSPVGRPTPFVRLAQHLARNGYVTMRVERPGCGDSEGGPFRDVDFETELSGNLQALRTLKKLDYVNGDNVLIYGFSMGGIMAPLLAMDEPVRGVAVYGTTCMPWFEGVMGQRRRLLSLQGLSPAQVNATMRGHVQLWYQLAVQKKTVREIAETQSIPQSVWDQWITGEAQILDRHYSYYHQIADKELAVAWEKVAATRLPSSSNQVEVHPRVLAMWGESDWLTTREEGMEWIVASVNKVQPGNATSAVIKSSDHYCNDVATFEDSYRAIYSSSLEVSAGFNPAMIEIMLQWCDSTVSRPADI